MSKNPEPLPPNYRWNFFTFLTDFISFGVGFTFFSPDSVLPAFVLRLTEKDLVIGLAIAVFHGGWLLPQVITARLISDKPRKKPYMLVGMGGRILFLAIAVGRRGADATLGCGREACSYCADGAIIACAGVSSNRLVVIEKRAAHVYTAADGNA